MIDVKFNEAMNPLVTASTAALNHKDATPIFVCAAVVEALGIPAQMVANHEFRRDLALLVKDHTKLPPIRPDEPEAITEPNL